MFKMLKKITLQKQGNHHSSDLSKTCEMYVMKCCQFAAVTHDQQVGVIHATNFHVQRCRKIRTISGVGTSFPMLPCLFVCSPLYLLRNSSSIP